MNNLFIHFASFNSHTLFADTKIKLNPSSIYKVTVSCKVSDWNFRTFFRVQDIRNKDILVSDICPLKALIFTIVCTNTLTNKPREGSWELLSHIKQIRNHLLYTIQMFFIISDCFGWVETFHYIGQSRPVYAWTIVGAK